MKGGKDEIMDTYPSDRRYLSFPETKDGCGDSDTFIRRIADLGSWQMLKRFVLFLIKIRIMGSKTQVKRNSPILIIKVQFYALREICGWLEIVIKFNECKIEKRIRSPHINKIGDRKLQTPG